MDFLSKLFKVLVKLERVIGAVLLFTILTVVFVATVGRYTALYRVLFSEELARFCMIWLVFFGAAVCGLDGNLFNVDLIAPRLPKTGKIIFYVMKMAFTVVFCIFTAKYGIVMIERQIKLKQVSAMMGVPYAFMYSSVPLGCLLIAFHYSVRTILDIHDVCKKEPKGMKGEEA